MSHIADRPARAGIVGSMKTGVIRGFIEDADLATDVDTAQGNVDTRVASMHIADRLFDPIATKVAIEKGEELSSGLAAGGDASAYDALAAGAEAGGAIVL